MVKFSITYIYIYIYIYSRIYVYQCFITFLLGKQRTQCTKNKTYLFNTRSRLPSNQYDQDGKQFGKTKLKKQPYERNAKQFVCPQRKKSVIIQRQDFNDIPNDSFHKHEYGRKETDCGSSRSSRGFKSDAKSFYRLRKCSSWPAVSYPGSDQSKSEVKRYDISIML